MNAAIEIGKTMDAAIDRAASATPAEQPTAMERASRHATLCVQSPD